MLPGTENDVCLHVYALAAGPRTRTSRGQGVCPVVSYEPGRVPPEEVFRHAVSLS